MQSTTPMTDVVRAAALRLGAPVVDAPMAVVQPGDLKGLPVRRA